MAVASRGVARARAATLPLPRRLTDSGPTLHSLVPSLRSVAAGLVLALVAVAAYGAVRQAGAFSVRDLEVRGAPPGVARQIQAQLQPLVGESLLTLDGERVVRLAGSVPAVAAVRYDRAFPSTLVVTVRRERPVALVRRGNTGWVVSERGRVLRHVARPRSSDLPRIWVPQTVQLRLGDTAAAETIAGAVHALRTVRDDALPVRIRTVVAEPHQLTFVLASGLELRLGDPSSLRLKLAVAREVLPRMPAPVDGGPKYLDLLVPERPVAGPSRQPANPRLDGRA